MQALQSRREYMPQAYISDGSHFYACRPSRRPCCTVRQRNHFRWSGPGIHTHTQVEQIVVRLEPIVLEYSLELRIIGIYRLE